LNIQKTATSVANLQEPFSTYLAPVQSLSKFDKQTRLINLTRGCTIGVANPNGTSTKEGKKTLKGRPLLLVFKHAKTKNLRTGKDGPADHQSLAHYCARLIILNKYNVLTFLIDITASQ
jgi:hypothetical protein